VRFALGCRERVDLIMKQKVSGGVDCLQAFTHAVFRLAIGANLIKLVIAGNLLFCR
jgi:hypothetical protein